MNNKKLYSHVLRFLLITSCVLALMLSLVACDIIGSIFKTSNDGADKEVTSVSISSFSGVVKREDVYCATLGKEFTVTASVNNDAPKNLSYNWFLTPSGNEPNSEPIAVTTTPLFAYTISSMSVTNFTLFVKVNDIESEVVSFVVEYAQLEDVQIQSTSPSAPIVDGTIQQSTTEIAPISLNAEFGKQYLDPSSNVEVKWLINNIPYSTDESITYTPTPSTLEYKITVTVTIGNIQVSDAINLKIIAFFAPVDRVELRLDGGATVLGSGLDVQYTQINSARSSVTVSAHVNSNETNLNAPVTWTLRNQNGTNVLGSTGRTVTFTPAYGENYVTASIENVDSRHLNVIAMTPSDFDANKSFIQDTFLWQEGANNHYITDQHDFNVLVNYVATKRIAARDQNDTANITSFRTSTTFDFVTGSLKASQQTILNNSIKALLEGGVYQIHLYDDYTFYFDEETTIFGSPTTDYTPAADVEQATNVLTHYTANQQLRQTLPVDFFPTYPDVIKTSDMLAKVVSWGYKPTFSTDSNGQRLSNLYKAARSVSIVYLTDDMTDYEKVLAIYEWIAQTVDYDYAITQDDSLTLSNKIQYNAYYLEGVFSNSDGEGHGQAVCDGRAKAFILLCGMEGIKAVRISGNALIAGGSEPHAWNKVLIDADGDGIKEWYACDTTWADRSSSNTATRTELLTMQYFLVNDNYIRNSHQADEAAYNPSATAVFDYYASTSLGEFDLYINSDAELSAALAYSRSSGNYIDVRIETSYAADYSELQSKVRTLLPALGTSRYTISYGVTNTYIILIEAA